MFLSFINNGVYFNLNFVAAMINLKNIVHLFQHNIIYNINFI